MAGNTRPITGLFYAFYFNEEAENANLVGGLLF